MAKEKVPKEIRDAIHNAKNMVETIFKDDANEAETRRRVERIFENVLGYDAFKHLSRERAVKGAGETEHMDFTIQLAKDAKTAIIVELKRVAIDLAPKHVKQVVSYAIDTGCEWILLTNSREWRIYHIEYGQPPDIKLLEHWDLLKDDTYNLARKFALLNLKNVKKGILDDLWSRTKVLAPKSLLASILSEDSIKLICRNLKKVTGVSIAPEDVVGGFRKLLNESASIEMDGIRITLPNKKRKSNQKESDEREKEEGESNKAKESVSHEDDINKP